MKTYLPSDRALFRLAEIFQLSPVSSDDQSPQTDPPICLVGNLQLRLDFRRALEISQLDKLADGLID